MEKFKFNKKTDELFKAIIGLKNVREAEQFFRDLCTIDEIREMSERWQIARLVDRGLPYREIAEKLAVSTTTVARVAAWLYNGAGGYRLILDRLLNTSMKLSASHHTPSKLRKGLLLSS